MSEKKEIKSIQTDIEIAKSNMPTGEPVIVMMVNGAPAILDLQLAFDVANGLLKSVATSECAEPLVATIVSSTASTKADDAVIQSARTLVAATGSEVAQHG